MSHTDDTSADAPDLDERVLGALLSDLGDEQGLILVDLETNFRQQASDQVATLQRAADSGDVLLISKNAHGLKGQALTLGLSALARHASRIEQLAKASDQPACLQLVRMLPEVFARASAALARRVAG